MRCIYIIYKLAKLLYPKYSDKIDWAREISFFSNFADYFKIFSELRQNFVKNKRKKGH